MVLKMPGASAADVLVTNLFGWLKVSHLGATSQHDSDIVNEDIEPKQQTNLSFTPDGSLFLYMQMMLKMTKALCVI